VSIWLGVSCKDKQTRKYPNGISQPSGEEFRCQLVFQKFFLFPVVVKQCILKSSMFLQIENRLDNVEIQEQKSPNVTLRESTGAEE